MSPKVQMGADRILELIIYALERDNAAGALAFAKDALQSYREIKEREKKEREKKDDPRVP